MGRTACTEPQCLYKGDLYLYLTTQVHNSVYAHDSLGGERNASHEKMQYSYSWKMLTGRAKPIG